MSTSDHDMSSGLALSGRDGEAIRIALDALPLFAGVPLEDRTALAKQFEKRVTRKDEVLIKQGGQGSVFYVLPSGKVRVEREEAGVMKRIADLGPGTYFGEMSLISSEPRNASVIVEEPGEILTLSRASFREILEKHPAVAAAIEKTAAERRGVSGAMEVAEWMGSMLKWTGVVPKG